jgi:hypothetical protein
MATNQQGSLARYNTPQQIDYLRARVTFSNSGAPVAVGILPPGAVILKALSGVTVETVFNAGTTNTVDIGVSGTAGLYGSALSLTAQNFVPVAQATSYVTSYAGDTTILATVNLSGTAATTGVAHVVIAFVPNNDK